MDVWEALSFRRDGEDIVITIWLVLGRKVQISIPVEMLIDALRRMYVNQD
jgi:hypothetical protein